VSFGFNKWESVKQFICGVGNIDYVFLRYLSMVLMYKSMLESNNNVVKLLMHIFSMTDEFNMFCRKLSINVADLKYLSRYKLTLYIFSCF